MPGMPSISVDCPATLNSKLFSALSSPRLAVAVTVTIVSAAGLVNSPFFDIISSSDVVHVTVLPFLPSVIVSSSRGSTKYPSARGTDKILSSVISARSASTASRSLNAAFARIFSSPLSSVSRIGIISKFSSEVSVSSVVSGIVSKTASSAEGGFSVSAFTANPV